MSEPLLIQRKCAACEAQDHENDDQAIERKAGSLEPDASFELQRQCAACEQCDECDERDEQDEEANLRRKARDTRDMPFDATAPDSEDSEDENERGDDRDVPARHRRRPRLMQWQAVCADHAKQARSGRPFTPRREPVRTRAARLVREAMARSHGEALAPAVRKEMEHAYGVDLSNVRIHDDALADAATRAVAAHAYTLGQSIWFASGRYQPHTPAGRELLAHELAHVVQNRNAVAPPAARKGALRVSAPSDPQELEADAAAHAVTQGRAVRIHGSGGGMLNRNGTLDSALDWGKATARRAEQSVASKARAVARFANEQSMKLVRLVAPGLAAIIDEGPANFARRKVSEALDAHMPKALGGFSAGEIVDGVRGWLGEARSFVKALANRDDSACAAFAGFMSKLSGFVGKLIDNPVVNTLTTTLGTVSGFLAKALRIVGEPLFDGLQQYLAGAWSTLRKIGSSISQWFGKAKAALGDLWTDLMSYLGFDGSSEDGVWTWIKREAAKVWEAIRTELAPVFEPLKTVASVIALLTPMGQIHAIVKYGPKLVEVAQWIWQHGLSPDEIRKAPKDIRAMLETIGGNVNGFHERLHDALDWLSDKLARLVDAMLKAGAKITGLPLVGFAHALFDETRERLDVLVTQIRKDAQEVLTRIEVKAQEIDAFIKPYKGVISSVIIALAAPVTIPVLLAGWAWTKLPDCVKAPIVDFVLDIAIGALSKIPSLPTFGLLWPVLKPTVLAFLQTLRAAPAKAKEAISNKIARILSGADPVFLLAFVKGFAQGIWDGIKDPFSAIWSVMEGLDRATEYLLSLAGLGDATRAKAAPDDAAAKSDTAALTPEQAPEQAPAQTPDKAIADIDIDALKSAAGDTARAIGPNVVTVKENFWDAVREYFNGESITFDDMLSRLSEAWGAARAKLAEGGAWLAKQLMGFFEGPSAEAELGDKIGWLTGTVVFQVVLDALTVGSWSGVSPVLTKIAKFINWPMEALGEAFKLLKSLGKYLLEGLKSLGAALKEAASGAFRTVARAIRQIGETLIEFGERVFGKAGTAGKAAGLEARELRGVGEAAGGIGEREGGRVAGKNALAQGETRSAQAFDSTSAATEAEAQAAATTRPPEGEVRREIDSAAELGPSALPGHEFKVTESGRLIRCSNECQLMAQRYAIVLESNPKLLQTLKKLEKDGKKMSKGAFNKAVQELEEDILDTAVRDAIRATGRDIKDVKGAMEAIRANPEALEKLFDVHATRTRELLKATGEEMLDAASHTTGVSAGIRDKVRANATTRAQNAIDNVNYLPGMADPALPGKVVLTRLESDHLFALKRILQETGIGELSYEEILYVARYRGNFAGLSKSANASKGAKSFAEWLEHRRSGIKVDPKFRRDMYLREVQAENEILELIEWLRDYGV